MTEGAEGRSPSRPGGGHLARLGAWIGIAVGAVIAVLNVVNGDGPERWSEAAGFGMLFGAPFGLAWLATRLTGPGRREAVWYAAGALGLTVGVLSGLVGLLLMIVPSVLVIAGAVGEHRLTRPRPRISLIGLFAFVVLTGVGAGLALFLRADPRCHPVGTTGVSCTSDAITWIEAAISMSIWAFTFAVIAAALAGDRRERVGARPDPIRPRTPSESDARGNGKAHVAGEAKP